MSAPKDRHPGGRPTDYTNEVADYICEQLVEGRSLRDICREESMPNIATVFRWLHKFPEFGDQYARAREEQAETLADEIISIADDKTRDMKVLEDGREVPDAEVVARSRLRVEARKWVASKLKPKKYGDKIQQEHTSPDGSMGPTRIEIVAPNVDSKD